MKKFNSVYYFIVMICLLHFLWLPKENPVSKKSYMDFLELLRNQMFKINLFKTWQKYFP